jgi:hypothetical protein
MVKIASGRARQAAALSLLAVLSAVPYAMVYAIDRGLGVPNALRSALWPAAVVPALVAGVLVVHFVRARTSQQANLAAVAPLAQRRAHDRAA